MPELDAIPITRPDTGADEWQAVKEVIESGWLTQGDKVKAFEAAFAELHGVKHAVAASSCTTALHLALVAAGVGPGDEVIVPAFTWVATANAVVYCGATPVFADVDPGTYNLDPACLADALSERTKAVLPVHLFGLSADLDAIRAAVPEGVAIIEDAACAVGASYKGRPVGGIGAAGCFSFHPRKIVTTGEGGMVTTDDDGLAARVGTLRNHGAAISEEDRQESAVPYLYPDFDVLGFNYRMSDVLAAIGLVQLGKLPALLAHRRRGAAWYAGRLAGLNWLTLPAEPEGYGHGWQAYVTVVADDAPVGRNEILKRLNAAGIGARPGTHAITELGYYRDRFGTGAAEVPAARMLDARSLALPLHARMSEADFERVAAELEELQN